MSKRLLFSSGIIIVSLAFNATAFASDGAYKTRSSQTRTPTVIGTVSSVSGLSITLNAENGATYLIDTSNAKITKSNNQIRVSDISNGDTLLVVGKIDNNNINAIKIINKVGTRIVGRVETITANNILVKDNKGTIYTVDITKAKIMNNNKTIQVDDQIVVFGSQTSGTTNITATVIR